VTQHPASGFNAVVAYAARTTSVVDDIFRSLERQNVTPRLILLSIALIAADATRCGRGVDAS
jgi:hypothetical protein